MSNKNKAINMKPNANQGLAAYQKANCIGCRFADPVCAGKGIPCCTYSEKPSLDSEGNCLTKRIDRRRKSILRRR